MTTQQLTAIRERAEKATAGPWESGGAYIWLVGTNGQWKECLTHGYDCELCPQDADFIAHARTDIPDLLAYIAELEAKLNASSDYKMEAVCANCGETYRQHLGYDCAAKPGLVFKPKSP